MWISMSLLCVLVMLAVLATSVILVLMKVREIFNLRVFEDESGKHWSKSVMDKQYEVLCVSQFTLQCVLKGNKPDFHLAMPREQAESFYNSFLEQMRRNYRPELIQDVSLVASSYGRCGKSQVVDGQTITLVPPMLLITWNSHFESVTDILYVDIYQVIISAGQDGNVKAWKLSGCALGTFGVNIWQKLQETTMDNAQQQAASLEEKAELIGTSLKSSFLELQKDLAEALMFQWCEQAALMALLQGKAEKEAKAWTRLQKMAFMSPWAGEHSPKDIEETWNQWESKDKQSSKIVGAAYKPKEHVRNPKLLDTRVQYGWMRQQISPQVYQSLYFTDLKPVQQPDFLMHKVLDQQGRHIRWVASDIPRKLESIRGQIFTDSTPAASPSSASLMSLGASASRVLDLNCSTSLRSPSSLSLLRPWSASPAQTSSSASPQTLSLPHKGQRL